MLHVIYRSVASETRRTKTETKIQRGRRNEGARERKKERKKKGRGRTRRAVNQAATRHSSPEAPPISLTFADLPAYLQFPVCAIYHMRARARVRVRVITRVCKEPRRAHVASLPAAFSHRGSDLDPSMCLGPKGISACATARIDGQE